VAVEIDGGVCAAGPLTYIPSEARDTGPAAFHPKSEGQGVAVVGECIIAVAARTVAFGVDPLNTGNDSLVVQIELVRVRDDDFEALRAFRAPILRWAALAILIRVADSSWAIAGLPAGRATSPTAMVAAKRLPLMVGTSSWLPCDPRGSRHGLRRLTQIIVTNQKHIERSCSGA